MSMSNNANNQQESLLGDLEKTITINQLMQTPFEERDEQWRDLFLKYIDEANLKLGEPEVALSNDGFLTFSCKLLLPAKASKLLLSKNSWTLY